MHIKKPTEIPMSVTITYCPAGKAHGLDKPEAKVKGGYRGPAAMTRGEKLRALRAMEGSISPADMRRALNLLGVK